MREESYTGGVGRSVFAGVSPTRGEAASRAAAPTREPAPFVPAKDVVFAWVAYHHARWGSAPKIDWLIARTGLSRHTVIRYRREWRPE